MFMRLFGIAKGIYASLEVEHGENVDFHVLRGGVCNLSVKTAPKSLTQPSVIFEITRL
jgi:hypothetical protein